MLHFILRSTVFGESKMSLQVSEVKTFANFLESVVRTHNNVRIYPITNISDKNSFYKILPTGNDIKRSLNHLDFDSKSTILSCTIEYNNRKLENIHEIEGLPSGLVKIHFENGSLVAIPNSLKFYIHENKTN